MEGFREALTPALLMINIWLYVSKSLQASFKAGVAAFETNDLRKICCAIDTAVVRSGGVVESHGLLKLTAGLSIVHFASRGRLHLTT